MRTHTHTCTHTHACIDACKKTLTLSTFYTSYFILQPYSSFWPFSFCLSLFIQLSLSLSLPLSLPLSPSLSLTQHCLPYLSVFRESEFHVCPHWPKAFMASSITRLSKFTIPLPGVIRRGLNCSLLIWFPPGPAVVGGDERGMKKRTTKRKTQEKKNTVSDNSGSAGEMQERVNPAFALSFFP